MADLYRRVRRAKRLAEGHADRYRMQGAARAEFIRRRKAEAQRAQTRCKG